MRGREEILVTGIFLYILSTESQCSPPDIASNASAYSTFAGVLAGFSFTALVVYLQRRAERPESGASAPTFGSQVATGLLYSTASLIISSFLYANLISQAKDFQRAAGELLIYGGVLGLSVLVMLYSLTLMIYEVPYTKDAVKYAYWLTVIAGPAVIFRFLVDVAQLVWHSGRVAGCMPAPLSGAISLWGGAGIAALLLISSLITVFGFLRWFKWTRERVVRQLAKHPTIPALAVFIIATGAAIASIAVTGPASFTPARNYFTGPVLGAEFASLAGFALVCGCVIGERTSVILPGPLGRETPKRWIRWLQDRSASRAAILPPDDIQDLDDFRGWLAGMASALTSCRSEAHDAISRGGTIPFEISVDLRNKLRALTEGLRLADSPTQPGKPLGAGPTFSVETDAAEAKRYQGRVSRLQEDSAILFEWYLWFYRTGSPCPEGMFGAIRTKRELSMRMLDDLSAVLHFIEYLRDRRRPPSRSP
jgi:hypothetical protein